MARTLSVITPSYNQGEYIERTIRSVLDQGYANLEYVIVDGGSTDDTVEIIRRYEDRLTWWVSEPDGGQSEAINKGIERTSGEIVAFINSDDYYLPGAFATAIGALERNGAGWVAGGALDVEEGNPPRRIRVWRPRPPSASEGFLRGRHWWMLVPWHVPQPSSFWRRGLFESYGLFRTDMHYAFDAEFMLRLAYEDELPALLPDEFLSTRSVHPNQKTFDMTRSWPEIDRFVEIFQARLTRGERMRMKATLGLTPVRASQAQSRLARIRNWIRWRIVQSLIHYVLGPMKRQAVTPVLTWAGDMLEHVPERWRPPIRTRDRQRKGRTGSARPAESQPPPSPVGLEPVARDPGPAVAQWPEQPERALTRS